MRPSVFGWESPWSGSERDPITWRYRAWYRLYRLVNVARHCFGLHNWRARGWGLVSDGVYVARHDYCDWCGATRSAPGEEGR